MQVISKKVLLFVRAFAFLSVRLKNSAGFTTNGFGSIFFPLKGFSLTVSTTGNEESPEDDVKKLLLNNSASGDSPSLKAERDAYVLRQRAKELLAEARVMEIALLESRSAQTRKQRNESGSTTDRLLFENTNGRLPSSEEVAAIMKEERWSTDQVLLVLEELYRRLQLLKTSSASTPSTQGFQIADTRNAAAIPGDDTKAFELLDNRLNCLIEASTILDEEIAENGTASINSRWSGRVQSTLKSRFKALKRADEEDLKRLRAVQQNQLLNNADSSNVTIQDYMLRTLGLDAISATGTVPGKPGVNVSGVMERIAVVPRWIPPSLLRSILSSESQLLKKDATAVKDQVLKGSNFFCTSTDFTPMAAVYRGNLRSSTGSVTLVPNSAESKNKNTYRNFTAEIFEDIQRRLNAEGLSDRVQLFFLQDPEWPTRDERETEPKPVILAISKAVVPGEDILSDKKQQKKRLVSVALKRASFVLALTTAAVYSVNCYALNPKFFESIVNQQDSAILVACLPIYIGVLAIQLVHETAHYTVAKIRGIKIGPPLPLPSTQVGTLGCITPLKSFPSSRAALLDFALSGPMAAVVLSIILMIVGSYGTLHASASTLSNFPVVPVSLLKSSFLTGSILTILLPKVMMLPLSQPIPIHPFFMIGFAGLLSSALNLLPIFRLDGGRACTAACGSRVGALTSIGTLLFMLSLVLSGDSSGNAFVWGLIIILFQRQTEIPVRDEITEVDDVRTGAWVSSLVMAVLALAPFPGGKGFL